MSEAKLRTPAGFIRLTDVPRSARFKKLVFEGEIKCPAGERISESFGGTACRCRVTHSTVTAANDPSSLARFCMGDYTACPVWRGTKEDEWSKRDLADAEREGSRRSV